MFRDLNVTSEESIALLECLVHSDKISLEEIKSSLACIRNKKKKESGAPLTKTDLRVRNAKAQKLQQTLDQSRYRHVALRISYDGSSYNGFAQNCGSETDNSVEKHLFAALTKTCLVVGGDRSSCNYSRCGRTDRGVSAFGQVIGIHLRSRIPKVDGNGVEIQELPKNSYETIRVNQKNNVVEMKEMDYCRILNGVLPETIRAIGWTPVSNEFSARFSARDRTYRYFFVRKSLDLKAMQRALDKLVGRHDFRNFCKIDTEAVSNFARCIKYAEIVVVPSSPTESSSSPSMNHRQMCYFEICGQAFLWHMIRCIVAVCFMVGMGDEDPSVIDFLLNVDKCPAKPSYSMAPDPPLVLHSCSYENLIFGHSSVNLFELTNTLERSWEDSAVTTERIRNAIESLQQEAYVELKDFIPFLMDLHNNKQRKNKRDKLTEDAIEIALNKVQINKVADVDTSSKDSSSTVILWKDALLTIREVLGASSSTRSNHTQLLQRSTGTTYEEKLSLMKGKKRERYEMNMMKKQQSKGDDKDFYERMTKYGGSGIS